MHVIDDAGNAVPAQRLHDGRLAFLAEDVPALGARRFRLTAGEPDASGQASAAGMTLQNEQLSLELDPKTGAIMHLRSSAHDGELVDASGGIGMNDYFYVRGKDPRAAVRNGTPKIEVWDAGPLVASLRVTSDAPGCRSLVRDVRVYSGLARVEFDNMVDKEKVREKEGVHLAFPFNVPGGVLRMDTGYAVVRPETDQLPGSCKNWFAVGRFVDVSNLDYGATWTTLDAPLVEVGGITAETPWIQHLAPSTTFYSYVMNNYWHTNYKADQEGPTHFRYALDLHGPLDPAAVQRTALERSQPLLVAPATQAPPARPLLYIDPPAVLATHLFPADSGKALIVRLYNAGAGPATAQLHWTGKPPRRIDLADPDGRPLSRLPGDLTLPPGGLATLRVTR